MVPAASPRGIGLAVQRPREPYTAVTPAGSSTAAAAAQPLTDNVTPKSAMARPRTCVVYSQNSSHVRPSAPSDRRSRYIHLARSGIREKSRSKAMELSRSPARKSRK